MFDVMLYSPRMLVSDSCFQVIPIKPQVNIFDLIWLNFFGFDKVVFFCGSNGSLLCLGPCIEITSMK